MKALAAWSVLLTLMIGNVLVLRVCVNAAPEAISAAPVVEPEQKDCDCPDGFCPHHHKPPSPPKSKDEDCTCRLLADDKPSITATAFAPVILPDAAPPLLRPAAPVLAVVDSDVLELNRVPATPPPRA